MSKFFISTLLNGWNFFCLPSFNFATKAFSNACIFTRQVNNGVSNAEILTQHTMPFRVFFLFFLWRTMPFRVEISKSMMLSFGPFQEIICCMSTKRTLAHSYIKYIEKFHCSKTWLLREITIPIPKLATSLETTALHSPKRNQVNSARHNI